MRALPVLVAAAILAACGGGGGGSPTSPSTGNNNPGNPAPSGGSGNTISVAGTVFDPSSVTISQGQSVTWVFAGITHNVLFGGTGAPANIPETSTGTVSRTFNTRGTFSMTCTLHAGMTGTITVQ
ncbi:MAG: plastocyanin/azurin family copper-binding protein [Gemmatimonadota bacterium]|nr:plastocyanin/azurin family copper-binding protein [Gemmatimonadota bacterium]